MLKELYDKVFDSNGGIKPCGRDNCKKLIEACRIEFPEVDFGNPSTGYMNVENIKKYVK